MRKMARPGEVAFLLALFVLLGRMHGTRAQYEDYDDYDYEEDDYDDDDEEYEDEDGYPGYPSYPSYGRPPRPSCIEDEDGYCPCGYGCLRPQDDSEDGDVGGSPPTAFPENQEFTPDCNNEDCRIRVDWEPPPRDTWMSCLLGYRVGFRKDGSGDDWTWMNDEGTHRDLRSDKLFFFEEAEGTNHSLTIRNLEFQTAYEVTIEVFNPYGAGQSWNKPVRTPPGYFIYFQKIL